MTNIIAILFSCIIGFACAYTVSHNVIPFIVKHGMKELEKNPKWINTHIRDKYYGFYDIDIITADSKYGHLPYFRLAKDTLHLEILISNDTSINDTDDIAKLALNAKLRIRYGLQFPNKPAYWLAILCYMLDGGDIKQETTKWERAEDNKPIDFSEK